MATPSRAAGLVDRPSLTLKRRINAAPDKVYAAWADAQKLVRWFGPANTEPGSVRAELDVRVGGRFKASFTTVDGEYHEVSGV